MRYGSVCSGIEAATVAWEPLGWTPVFFSEIAPFPSTVLAHHYGSNMPGEPVTDNGVPNFGDMTKFEDWPDVSIDLLVGGTPCQDYSIAGRRLGMAGSRGQLTLTYVEIAARYRPRWFAWENVTGVLSSNDGRDFARFLGDLSGTIIEVPRGGWRNAGIVPGIGDAYGLAYRVLDAQYVRVDGFWRAVPQRRRRVFVVGYLGDWRRAAAVLLEPEGMRGDPAPRREQGQGVAGTLDAGLGVRGQPEGERGHLIAQAADVASTLDASFGRLQGASGQDARHGHSHLVVFGGNRTAGPLDVAAALSAHGGPSGRMDFESETFIAFDCKASGRNGFAVGDVAPTLRAMGHVGSNQNAGGQVAVAHTLKADGFDASEDGTGRGTPIVPIDLRQAVAFDTTQITSAGNYSNPKPGDACHPLAGGAHPPAVAFADQWAVRRLTPTECERLQGFPDGYTDVPWRGKQASPDGPRYRALGNSMAVNVMRWIGRRIEMVERIDSGGPAQ